MKSDDNVQKDQSQSEVGRFCVRSGVHVQEDQSQSERTILCDRSKSTNLSLRLVILCEVRVNVQED